ncbi:uncharacterized protein H6S33_002964 [Morchella sextelata]|uniref:uncharacterized protein n=1 Tax=Morchella sextelata TaxID=1174677 RepID=UPI001D05C033|nr:uncharacterized protein H6S33_002964 [Morchella sextelata]KAH0606976.1 hypothetical protein H6S33_002964 [Morchella sextelata]
MEVAGLVFGVLGALDVCLRVSKEINGLVRDFKNVGLDFEWASKRLDIHNAQFKSWIEFWDIKKSTPTKTFHTLWGPEGTKAIHDHLEGLEILCTKAAQSQEKYKRTLERAGKTKLKAFQMFRGKFRYTISGKNEFEENLNKLRSEFGLVEREAEEFFLRCHPNTSRGSISKAMIDDIVKESAMMDDVMKIQQITMHLFNGLDLDNLPGRLELSLQPDYVSKNQFRELEFDTQRLDKKSTKLPIIVNGKADVSFPDCQYHLPFQSVFVLEAGEEYTFETPQPTSLRVESFMTIVVSDQLNLGEYDTSLSDNESFSLKCPPNPKHEGYRFLVHRTGSSSISNQPRPLNELFDNIPRHPDQHPLRTKFPITWQFDLAYTLAASVLNLQGSGWLNTFHSENIYQRENLHRSTIHTLKVWAGGCKLSGYDLDETALDRIFRRPRNSYHLKPEIFLLGVLLLEIGLARSGWAILGDLEHIRTREEKLVQVYLRLDDSVCPKYTDITRACLEGDFEFDDDMDPQKTLKSYISKVLKPLKEECDNLSGNRGSRRRRKINVPWKITLPIAPREISFPELNDFGDIDVKRHRRRTSTWGGSTFSD